MKVITESFLRESFRKEIPETFKVEAGQILTPSAAQLLSEKGVKIVRDGAYVAGEIPEPPELPASAPAPKYVLAGGGGMFDTKPEHMTRLYGNRLVPKDHPRIFFRGRLDSIQSMILLAQSRIHEKGLKKLVQDLGEVLDLARAIMRAEVLDEVLCERSLMGLREGELREQSHNPEKYFGTKHLLVSFDMGWVLLTLNELRSSIREVEVLAVKAFRNEYEIEKPEIIQALNRMSSAVYIMMLKEKSGKYR
ncbi:hypothetical protein [Desulfobotulus mexicanus]|uniref:Cobalamin adenosyltransferase-like domain-containing protein n=1 Tax=Desulfobotulus mexicanus TaxID=2586642 RepID=A0A5S5MF21_9BACT|nr:hypothetical protein [Desulfobotulus mexicanus]TYT74290.1 hypothetical protein FIM25_11000 [Desulfobotulus mexicanus]